MALAHWRAVATYSCAVRWPICQSPYISLPRPQYRTRYGSSCPLARRRLAQYVSPVPLQYSTQASASSRVPVPMFRHSTGSTPAAPAQAMNSSVPNRLDSSLCQASSARRGRSSGGPMPSVQ